MYGFLLRCVSWFTFSPPHEIYNYDVLLARACMLPLHWLIFTIPHMHILLAVC